MGERLAELARKVFGAIAKGLLIGILSILLLAGLMWGLHAAGVMDSPREMLAEAFSVFGDGLGWKQALGTLALSVVGFFILMDILDEMAGMGPYERYRDWRDDRRGPRDHGGGHGH